MNSELIQLSHTLLPVEYMQDLLQRCLNEDGGFGGDVTTASIIPPDEVSKFAINVRGHGTIAGLGPISRAMNIFKDIQLTLLHQDGESVRDENIALIEGKTQTIVFAERTLLNILGHASGIATRTKRFVDAIADTECNIYDTRKTTPGLRMLDKYAVVCGGGTSHRFGLHDAALYKDNHLAGLADFSAQLSDAILKATEKRSLKFVEVEVDSIEQLEHVLAMQVDIILLDNMTNEQLSQAVVMRDDSALSPQLEASGGVDLDTVRAIAETGVDRISVGGLTHQSHWLDIGLDAIDE